MAVHPLTPASGGQGPSALLAMDLAVIGITNIFLSLTAMPLTPAGGGQGPSALPARDLAAFEITNLFLNLTAMPSGGHKF